MSVEKLKAELAVVKTSNDMSDKELFQASKEMNNIIRKELAKARDEGNTNQFASLLAEYRKIWYNKPGLDLHKANLSYAYLSGVNLRGAYLSYANLSYAYLSYANLSYANLSYANLGYANLSYANLSYANLRKANLLSADLSGANLREANLSNANLNWANLNWANLRGVNLSKANLRDANLWWANLSDADLSGFNLRGANLSGANLSDADLSGVNLSDADLSGVNLSLANLLRANLSNAYLRGANLRGANLHGAITIGADFTEVKNGIEPMTKDELQAKLADAIKTLDELRSAIQRFLEGSNENPVTKQDLDILPSLYKAALDIGNNGAKNRKDESVICQPSDAICQELLSSAHILNEKFPVLTVTPFSGLYDKMKGVLEGRGCKVSNFMAAVTFLCGIYADKKDSSSSEGVKIVSTFLSNGGEAEYLTIQMADQLCAQASNKQFSAIKLKHVLSPDEKALPPVKAILTLEARIIEAVSVAKDGEKIIIKATKKYSSDTVKDALKEASGKQILPDTVELTREYKTSEKSKKIRHDNHIQITMPKDMVDAICPSKKKEEKTLSSPALKIKMAGDPPVLGSGVEQQRG